ncbi:MAG: hypothetical protein AB1454_14910 [Candidatus Auribacterota bacterium]
MAEFDFILSEEEQLTLIDFFFKTGARIVPDLMYIVPQVDVLNNTEEIVEIINNLKSCGPFCLTWDNYQTYPYAISRVDREEGTRYYLEQRYGGPYLKFFECRFLQRADKIRLTTGFIGHYPSYYIDDQFTEVSVPPELKERYKEITKFIRKMTKPAKGSTRKYWIGKEALKAVKSGTHELSIALKLPE